MLLLVVLASGRDDIIHRMLKAVKHCVRANPETGRPRAEPVHARAEVAILQADC
jgi:hypothetical protein